MANRRRGNSMIRGSGHSMHGSKAQRGSIMRRSKIVEGKTIEEDAAVYDLILLSELTEAAVIANTKALYYENIIYSYVGNVVISMNPFNTLPIYDNATIEKYRGRNAFDPKLPPHIYALADNAFSDMRWRGRDQVVIISGESGAGKTEAAKKVMQYVAAVSGSSGEVTRIKERLLQTNPLMESFGNAKTNKNDNSSRFGKYMDIQFDFKGEPAGGKITTYLLEKARLCRLGQGERNFHIFYQLLAGKAGKLGMASSPLDYAYLKAGDATVKGLNDMQWLKEVEDSFRSIGFTAEEQDAIWKVLGSILLLGNVKFASEGGAGSTATNIDQNITKFLACSEADVVQALTHNTVMVAGSPVSADLNPEQASAARDTLCKKMYERLFQWACDRINSAIAVETGIKAVIGVLDIYGFEIFEINSFEQFCINYCNEKLQQLFIELTLKTEQDEYVSEGIKWTPIEFFNNKVICDLVDGKKASIISTLDEESIRPGDKSDKVWLEKMTKTVGGHKHFVVRTGPKDKSVPENAFMLKHYAGDVVYSVIGFLDKNTDTLYKDLAQLMFESGNAITKACFPEGDKSTWAGASKRPATAGRLFVNSMNAMVQTLQTKVPSYVRCIKPNHTRSPMRIDDDLMTHQVKYLGLLENVRVRRAGYCFRETYKDFLWRYRMLAPATYPNWDGSDIDGCKEIFKSLAIRAGEYQCGKTKLFIKNPSVVFRLEGERDDRLDVIATRLQMGWRLYLVNKTIGTWFKQMLKQFKPVMTLDGNNPTYGFSPSKAKFPKPNASCAGAHDLLKGVYDSWWARKMVGPLPAEKVSKMRLQLLAHSYFYGKKDKFSLKTVQLQPILHGDPNPGTPLLMSFQTAHGKASFHCVVAKLTKKLKLQNRVLAITDTHFFRMKENWKFKDSAGKSRKHALTDIKDVTLSSKSDSMAVVHFTEPGDDLVVNLWSGGENAAYTFAIELHRAAKKAGSDMVIKIEDTLKFNNMQKAGNSDESVLKLMENPAGTPGTSWNPAGKQFLYY